MAPQEPTTEELIRDLVARTDLTERELLLLDKLQQAYDEVERLEAELAAREVRETVRRYG